MKSTNKHGKETAKSEQQTSSKTQAEAIDVFLASTGLFNPLSIALAHGEVRRVRPRGRPQVNSARDAQIVSLKDASGYSFGYIARKLKIRRETAEAAYYRAKRPAPTN